MTKKKIIIISIIVAVVLIAGIVIGIILANKENTDDKYIQLKSQAQVETDLIEFKTGKEYFQTNNNGIYRYYIEKEKTIIVSIENTLDERYYNSFEEVITFLNGVFETLNNNYKWEFYKDNELDGKVANIVIKSGDLESTDDNDFFASINTNLTRDKNKIIGAVVTIDTEDATKIPDSMLNVACLREFLITLGMTEQTDTSYYGKTVTYYRTEYTTQLKLLPYDIRSLIVAYCNMDSEEKILEMMEFTLDTKYVANTYNYRDLDEEIYVPSYDW